ncbi:MAG: nucleotidyltransferase family protein [Acidobacteriia bacterium]|nr:nucleotidyltransferase family protein [Terriglobia bacterium]
MARSPSLCGVILAAGESSRMGRDKALLPWPPVPAGGESYRPTEAISEFARVAAPPHTQTFLFAAISLLTPFSELVIVVGGKNSDSIAPVVYSTSASLVVNQHPERGQFSSLQVGLHEVLNRGRDSAIVTLVDRPPCSPETLRALCSGFREASEEGKWAVVPEYEGKHGHPVVIGREMIEAFLKAPAGSTARDVEHSVQSRILYFPVTDPGVVTNVDTPEDYQRLPQP